MKGFIFSIIAISFMLLLITLAITMSNEYWETERVSAQPQPLSYASATLESIGKLFVDVSLPGATVFSDNSSLNIRIADSVPRSGNGGQLATLKNYVEGDFADSLHADISVNTSQVDNSSLRATLADSFAYENGRNGTREALFGTIANASSTGAKRYSLNITVNEYRRSVSAFTFTPSGDMNVTIRYTDKNGTVEASGGLNSNAANTMTIDYGTNASTGNLKIMIGRVSQGSYRYDGALWMNASNTTSADFAFAAVLPLQPSNSSSLIVLPIEMRYVQGGITKTMNASR